MSFAAPIGVSDFRLLRTWGATYVDKTALVREVVSAPSQVLLVPRPRRFGKTLNLSMLGAFLGRSGEDPAPLFEGLDAWEDPVARAHFRRYPLISLTFEDVKHESWETCRESIGVVVAEALREHAELLERGGLSADEAREFAAVAAGEASEARLCRALRSLCRHLHAYHGEPAVLLIDEYDTPIHAGYHHGYYDRVVGFFRNLLSASLKDNPDLFRGVLTGILRVAKESVFSGLNNLAVHSILSARFATAFGFTEDEVAWLAGLAGLSERLPEIRDWYNGYRFGGATIYNPWSVLSYLRNPDDGPRAYWATTASDELIRELFSRGQAGKVADVEAILRGEALDKPVDENLVLRDLGRRPEAIWSLLLYSGYLRAEAGTGATLRLALPNREVAVAWRAAFTRILEAGLHGGDHVRDMLAALLAGDDAEFGRYLSDLLLNTLSYHDFGPRPRERVYHAFIAGMLVFLEPGHEVRSNRESGHGRYDVMVSPRTPGEPGVVLELKAVDDGAAVDQALDEACHQLRDRDYAADLRARGAAPVHELAVVFDGKRAHVRRLEPRGAGVGSG